MSSGPQGTSVSRDKGQKNHLIIIIFAIIFVIIIIIIIISIIITFLLINFLFSIWQNKTTIMSTTLGDLRWRCKFGGRCRLTGLP